MSILSNFTVVDLIKTRSASVATITGKVLKLNIQTAAELHYAPYVQVLVNPKDKQFAIRACKEDAPNAIAFSKPEHEQKYAIKSVLPPLYQSQASYRHTELHSSNCFSDFLQTPCSHLKGLFS